MRIPTRPFMVSALVVLVGCSSVTTPGSSPTPIAPSPASSQAQASVRPATPAPTITPTPSPTTAWTAVPEQAEVRDVQFQDVVWTGARFVAVAVALDDGGAFLESTDGLTWRVPSASPTTYPMRLAHGTGGIVAVGYDADGRAVSWHSTDGLSWSAPSATFGNAAGANALRVTDVVGVEAGWLAVGREDPPCNTGCGADPIRAHAWTSSDGLAWDRVADQPSFRDGALDSVVGTGSGFVAVGSSGMNAAAWTSSTGTAWSAAPDSPAFHAALSADGDAVTAMVSVAVGSGVIAAVGTEYPIEGDKPPTARAWWSLDGVTWVEAAGDRFAEGQLFAVAGTAHGFLGVGPSQEPSCLGGVWASDDGRSWTCDASGPENERMGPYAAAASAAIEIVVGLDPRDQGGDGLHGGVWWRPLT